MWSYGSSELVLSTLVHARGANASLLCARDAAADRSRDRGHGRNRHLAPRPAGCSNGEVPTEATPLFLVYGAAALDGPLYRIVARCPPTIDDFLSYEALDLHYNRSDYFKGVGISMHTTRKQSVAIARRYRRGDAVAILELQDAPVVWAQTGGAGHVTVWAPAEVLLDHVVQCESHE